MENTWLLVEWLEKDSLFPIYNIVNGNRVVGNDVTAGKVVEVRKKHSNLTFKKAQVIKVSDNKSSLKEVKSMLTRLNQQMKQTVDTCMNTIGALKSEIIDIYDNEDIEETHNLGTKKTMKKDKVKNETSTKDQETQTDNKYFTEKIINLQDSLEDGYKKLMKAVSLLNNNRKRSAPKTSSLTEKKSTKNIKENIDINFEPPRKISRIVNEEEINKKTHCKQIDKETAISKETEDLNNCQSGPSKVAHGELDKTANKINEKSATTLKETEEKMKRPSTITKLICDGESATVRSSGTVKRKVDKQRKTANRKSNESTQSSSPEQQLRKSTKKIGSYTETDEDELEKSDTVSRYAQNFSPPLVRHYVNTRKMLAPTDNNVKMESINYSTQCSDSGAHIVADIYKHGQQNGKCDPKKSAYNIIIFDADAVPLDGTVTQRQNILENNLLPNNTNDAEKTPFKGYEKTRQDRILKNNNSINYSDTKVAPTPCINKKTSTDLVPIGRGNTLVPRQVLEKLNWKSYTTATRKLLQAIFSRETLSTHSLSGKASPAFINRPPKKQLNPKVIDDIVMTVAKECETKESFIRTCITVKCADEAKMFKQRMRRLRAVNDENVNIINTTV